VPSTLYGLSEWRGGLYTLPVAAYTSATNTAPAPVRLAGSALDVFVDDLCRHLDGRPYRSASDPPIVPLPRRLIP
jgi:hypothetical protein